MSAVQGTRAPARSLAAAFLAEERGKLPTLWEEIARAEPGERLVFAAKPAFASLPLCDRLTEGAFEAAPRSLAEARELAGLGARLANRLELRRYPRALARDGRARAALASFGVIAATALARRGEGDRLAALLAGFPLEEAYFAASPRLGFLAQVFTWCAEPNRPLGPEALAALGRHVDDTLRAMPAAHPLVMALLAPAKAGRDSKGSEA